ncbi:hypothetical protein QBC40DRAFT_339512 [Triangularia verruculosa]|uniref:Pyrroloquinoline quinone-dependent pyranose dehydrogenase beta-propeller domain-containing protein n=1 Tax=Triangularia verruculosa TaxID=2587418 RepID=A0AAN6XHF4_9PEZI|nr:hypothetical protein QBC40DRAFT_339512 [Triangularia verruculosa]
MRFLSTSAALLLLDFISYVQAQATLPPPPQATTSSETCAISLTPSYEVSVAKGWTAHLIARNLGTARGIKLDGRGGLLVVSGQRGIIHLNITDRASSCPYVINNTTVIEDERLNHGIELSSSGSTLYASSRESVWAWDYNVSTATATNRREIITNMTNTDHVTRTLFLSPSNPDLLLVSRGSAENIDPLSIPLENGISQIRAFNISNLTSSSSPYNYATDGLLIGWGLRNSVGIASHPVTGGLFSVENNIDQTERLGVDIHEENPGEELNFHGFLNGSLLENHHHGYPHCFPLFNTTDFPEIGSLSTGDQFSLEQTAELNDEICARDYVPPRLTFKAHMAPLDIKFSPSGTKAYVSFHGSWNRDEPEGYKVGEIAWDRETGQPKHTSKSLNAARDLFGTGDIHRCRPDGICLRPVGLQVDDRDRIFVSSDYSGELWVLEQTGVVEAEEWEEVNYGGGNDDGSGNGGTGTGDGEPAETSNPAVKGVGAVRTEGWLVMAVTIVLSFVGGVFVIVA